MNHLNSDYFVTCSKTGDQFAGRHILADFWDVERMGDLDFIKETIEKSAVKALTALFSIVSLIKSKSPIRSTSQKSASMCLPAN